MLENMLSKKQFNMLFENSNDFVFLCERIGDDYAYIFVNRAVALYFDKVIVGKTVKTFDANISKDIILKYYNQALEMNTQQNFQDYSFHNSDLKKYETAVIPIVEEGRQFVLAITKEIAYERDLQDKYLFTRSLFYKTFLSTVLLSPDLKLLEANPIFLKMFQLDDEQVRNQDFLQLGILKEESMQRLRQAMDEIAEGQPIETKLFQFIDTEGHEYTFMTTFTPLIENGELMAMFLILQDITKHLDQQKVIEQTQHVLNTFKRAMNSASDITITNIDGVIIDANDRFVERTGYAFDEIIGHTHQVVNARYHTKEYFTNLWRTISNGNVWRGEICNRDKNGVTYWNDTTIIPLVDVNGQVIQYLGVHIDISEKKRAIAQLHSIERTFRLITENTNDLIIITDEYGLITYVSPSYVRLLGYREDDLIGRFYSQILHENSKETWQNLLNHNMHKGVELRLELQLIAKTGETFWTEAHCKEVEGQTKDQVHQMIMISREMTERKERENKLKFLAYHDSLTNLPNRRYMTKEFPNYVEQVNGQYKSIAIVFIDGDDFKEVNDQYGHDVGDDFIKAFSEALLQCVRAQDLVVRIGGDEFVIILTSLSRDAMIRQKQLMSFIKRVRKRLVQGWEIQGQSFHPTSSMGISFYPDHGNDLESLLDLADKALYEAKEAGKNNFCIYNATV